MRGNVLRARFTKLLEDALLCNVIGPFSDPAILAAAVAGFACSETKASWPSRPGILNKMDLLLRILVLVLGRPHGTRTSQMTAQINWWRVTPRCASTKE